MSQSKEATQGGVTVLGGWEIVPALRGGAEGKGCCHDLKETGAARRTSSARIPVGLPLPLTGGAGRVKWRAPLPAGLATAPWAPPPSLQLPRRAEG